MSWSLRDVFHIQIFILNFDRDTRFVYIYELIFYRLPGAGRAGGTPSQMPRRQAPSIELFNVDAERSSTPGTPDDSRFRGTRIRERLSLQRRLEPVMKHRWVVWIPLKSTWNNWKPVIRSAVAVRHYLCSCADDAVVDMLDPTAHTTNRGGFGLCSM